jgi:anti-sigma regulatory factor (Ser/Thr protein kinase)
VITKVCETRVFAAVPSSCGQARQFVSAVLGSVVAADRMSDVVLATSEFAANAVEHAAGDGFQVAVAVTDDHVIVHVIDSGSGPSSPLAGPRDRDLFAESGRGLDLVAAFTDAAGSEDAALCACASAAAGWCCWFRIDLTTSVTPELTCENIKEIH